MVTAHEKLGHDVTVYLHLMTHEGALSPRACGLARTERRASNPDVGGSNPPRPVSIFFLIENLFLSNLQIPRSDPNHTPTTLQRQKEKVAEGENS